MTRHPTRTGRGRGARSLPTLHGMYAPNAVLLVLGLLYLVVYQYRVRGVEALVVTTPARSQRILELERHLAGNPADAPSALELGQLYGRAGELPWSYDALRSAERFGPTDPSWRMQLALAYVGIGRNDAAVRILKQARRSCPQPGCPVHTGLWLDLLAELAARLAERGIDARTHPEQADAVWREVIKPVKPTVGDERGASPDAAVPSPRNSSHGTWGPPSPDSSSSTR